MISASIACPNCSAPWPATPYELATLTACPQCQQTAVVTTFPALFRPANRPAAPSENLLVEGEASCFYHPNKRAAVPCSACGRFLCTLCDVKLGDKTLCPGCIESGRTKGRLTELEPGRTLWDSTAFVLATVPLLLCFYPSILAAPAALVVALVGWKKPSSIIPRNKWRLWVAVILATLQIVGWVIFVVMIIKGAGENKWDVDNG